MSEANQNNTVQLAEHLGFKTSFKTLFAEGMTLVEETASYLDGEGREESRKLTKPASVLYASESMRLTTRLMQLASWLLLQRSVNEGDMTREQLASEKKKIKLDQSRIADAHESWNELPEEFRSLIERSRSLSKRIRQLDEELYGEGAEKTPPFSISLTISAASSSVSTRM